MSTEAIRFCDECGAANRSAGKFCAVCGKPLNIPAGQVQSAATGLLTNATLLKQRYRIGHKLGQGGFSAVYFAEDTVFNMAPRAIKEMSIQVTGSQPLDPQELQLSIDTFEREALLLAGLTHPNLPRIYDRFEEQQRWYIVMDYIEGQTVEALLDHSSGGMLELSVVLRIANQLCNVLHYLHTRQPPIIFRDLKPANMMITEDEHIYLIDFGIARLFKPGQTRDTVALGSPGYAAPEQYGRAQSTAQADIYSFGATLHHLLSGRDPSDDPFQFSPLVLDQYAAGPALATLIQRMISLQRDQRPSSVQEIKQELQKMDSLLRLSPDVKTKEQLLDEGEALWRLRCYQEALAVFEQAILIDPNYARAYGWRGATLYKLGRYQEALADRERAILGGAAYVENYAGKGDALWQLERYQEALIAFEQAIRVDPNYASAYGWRGATLYQLERYQEALADRERAILGGATDVENYAGKGEALFQLGRYQEALIAFEQAIQIDPSYASAYDWRAKALAQQRKWWR